MIKSCPICGSKPKIMKIQLSFNVTQSMIYCPNFCSTHSSARGTIVKFVFKTVGSGDTDILINIWNNKVTKALGRGCK